MHLSWADNSVKKIKQINPIINQKPDLYNINAYSKFGENPLAFSQVIVRNENMDVSRADNYVKKKK